MHGDGDTPRTALVVVTTTETDAKAVSGVLVGQLRDGGVTRTSGWYATVSAGIRGDRVVVAAMHPDDLEHGAWRLGELRQRVAEAVVVVVADATLLPGIAGAVRADLAVTKVADLPPLRELLTGSLEMTTYGDGQSRPASR